MLVQRPLGGLLGIGFPFDRGVFFAVYMVDVVLFVPQEQVGLVLRDVAVESGVASAFGEAEGGGLRVRAVGVVGCHQDGVPFEREELA